MIRLKKILIDCFYAVDSSPVFRHENITMFIYCFKKIYTVILLLEVKIGVTQIFFFQYSTHDL